MDEREAEDNDDELGAQHKDGEFNQSSAVLRPSFSYDFCACVDISDRQR